VDFVPGCEYMIAAQSAVTGTSAALLWPAAFSFIPPGFLNVGKKLKIEIWGKITTAASSPGTLTPDALLRHHHRRISTGASAGLPTRP